MDFEGNALMVELSVARSGRTQLLFLKNLALSLPLVYISGTDIGA